MPGQRSERIRASSVTPSGRTSVKLAGPLARTHLRFCIQVNFIELRHTVVWQSVARDKPLCATPLDTGPLPRSSAEDARLTAEARGPARVVKLEVHPSPAFTCRNFAMHGEDRSVGHLPFGILYLVSVALESFCNYAFCTYWR